MLEVLPVLVSWVNDARTTTAASLAAAQATTLDGSFPAGGATLRRTKTSSVDTARIWAADLETGKRRDLTGEEDRAFWTFAAVETLRHNGIRIEELTELSQHSLIQYAMPGTGEPVPLLQIAPSKTDTERLLVISPELADVLAAVISRIRARDGALGCVASYDSHERVWNLPMPLLFQGRSGSSTAPSPPTSSASRSKGHWWITQAGHRRAGGSVCRDALRARPGRVAVPAGPWLS